MEKSKKYYGIIVSLIIALLLGIVFFSAKMSSDEPKDTDDFITDLYDVSYFDVIKATDIKDFEKDKVYVVFIGRKTCEFSRQMLSVYKYMQDEYNFKTKYIALEDIIDMNGSIIDNNSYTMLKQLDFVKGQENTMNDLGMTPLILFLKNKKIIASHLGTIEKEDLYLLFDSVGLKKK